MARMQTALPETSLSYNLHFLFMSEIKVVEKNADWAVNGEVVSWGLILVHVLKPETQHSSELPAAGGVSDLGASISVLSAGICPLVIDSLSLCLIG